MPTYPTAQTAYHQHNYEQCISECTQILSQNPNDYQTWKLCAFALCEMGEWDKSIEYLEYVLTFCSDTPTFIALAEVYRRAKKPQKSIEILSVLLPSKNTHLHFNLARAYSDLGENSKSIKHYKIALKFNPDDAQTLYNLGNQFLECKDYLQAKKMFIKALELGFQQARNNLASVYNHLFEEQKALEIYGQISDFKDPYFCFNYANTLCYNLKFKEAKEMYQKALSLSQDPIFYINYAYLLFRLGEFEEGFRFYEKRLLLPNILPLEVKNTSEKSLEGKKVLVYYEQGLGDSLMFKRFLDKLIDIAKEVQIYIQEPLYELFVGDYGSKVKSKKQDITPYECAFSLLSLPAILGANQIKLPPKSYQISQPKKIGIFFDPNKTSPTYQDRFINPEILIQALQGFEIYSLQPEGIDKRLCEKFNVIDLSLQIKNFKDSLNELKKLDLLVSVDSAIAHLAGNYGIACVVLLPKRYDWRWGKLGQRGLMDLEWYDCVKGIAQQKAKDWGDVLETLKRYLKNV